MTEATPTAQEAVPNAYNAKKAWHSEVKEPDFVDANSLFVPSEPQAKLLDPNVDTTPEGVPSTATTPQPIADVDWKKRYDDLKGHYDSKVNEHKQELVQVKAAIEVEKPTYVPPKTVQELEEFKVTNPDIYAVVETISHLETEGITKKLDEISERDKLVRMREARSDLLRIHPDFESIKDDPEFHTWAKTQDQGVQDWIFDNPYNGTLAARAIDLYKADKGIVAEVATESTPTEDPNVSIASLIPTRTSGVDNAQEAKIWTRTEINAMSIDDYDRNKEDIHIAMMGGRIRP